MPGRDETLDASDEHVALEEKLRAALRSRLDHTVLQERKPPLTAKWTDISTDNSVSILAKLTRKLIEDGDEDPWPLAHERIALRSTPIPFYEDALFFDAVVDHRMGWLGHATFIIGRGGFHSLTVNSTEVHEINHRKSPDLNDAKLAELYLRFFCWVVCAQHGPFLVIDHIDRLHDIKDEKTLSEIQERIETAQAKTPYKDDNGNWIFSRIIFYEKTIFESVFSVYPNGLIEMLEDDEILELDKSSSTWELHGKVRYLRKEA